MKFKASEITNSSSTTFLLGIMTGDGSVDLNIELRVVVNLKEFLERTLKSVEDLDAWVDDWYGDPSALPSNEYDRCKNILEKGGVVQLLHVTDESDNPLEVFLTQNGIENVNLPDNIVVIRGQGGY